MKGIVCGLIKVMLLLSISTSVVAQQDDKRLFRVFFDNDFFNINLRGTDEAYTYGLRFDYMYRLSHPPKFFLSRILPKAGPGSIDEFSWSLMQMAYTPRDISTFDFQPNDYPYSGALFLTHARRSYNPIKKYSFQTEILVGMLGPASLADESQKLFHELIKYQLADGWNYQLDNAPLINLNFTAEKQMYSGGKIFDVIAGTRLMAGTFNNSATIYPLFRFGKMNPYFKGFINQYSSEGLSRHKWQIYAIFKPEASWNISNALLTGIGKQSYLNEERKRLHPLEKFTYAINYGAVVSWGHWSLTYTQTHTPALLDGLYTHTFGNFSLYYCW